MRLVEVENTNQCQNSRFASGFTKQNHRFFLHLKTSTILEVLKIKTSLGCAVLLRFYSPELQITEWLNSKYYRIVYIKPPPLPKFDHHEGGGGGFVLCFQNMIFRIPCTKKFSEKHLKSPKNTQKSPNFTKKHLKNTEIFEKFLILS